VLTSLEVMAALIAAMIHDYAHPGVNNNFLIKIEHPLALRYNDRFAFTSFSFSSFFFLSHFLVGFLSSVLENYHVSEAFRLMKTPDMNFIINLTAQQQAHFRT